MPKYLFTSDQRISVLPNRIGWVANYVQSGHDVSSIADKSENNNASTLKFYYNLHYGTETSEIATHDPFSVIRNFVMKFQFPNTRTPESLADSISEKTLFAPFRCVIKVLHRMAFNSKNGVGELSISEILYFLFCNTDVCRNPNFDCDKVISMIYEARNNNVDLSLEIEKLSNQGSFVWKQFGRQARELFKVLDFASSCFKSADNKIRLSTYLPSYKSDEKFINEVLNYNQIWYPSNPNNFNLSNSEYISFMDTRNTPYTVLNFNNQPRQKPIEVNPDLSDFHQQLISALHTKPFALLAGISGTGKSRIVRELAKACWPKDSEERQAHKPGNFEMVQVRPNWHDSTDVLGYVSRISGKPEFVAGDFLKFIVRAWENIEMPHFLCLDEMNLAPVEQYFAEYLSVIETRKLENGRIVTDPILKIEESRKDKEEELNWYEKLVDSLLVGCPDEKVYALRQQFLEKGISIPQNLFVVGTVNMDETTFSFSRKVLDRAMTIEMNEVDLKGGLEADAGNEFGEIGSSIIPQAVEGKDVYADNKELCDEVLEYLEEVNKVLDKTPFKIAYRTRNEFLVYAVTRGEEHWITALDEMTSMKILSRIEGDKDRTEEPLNQLKKIVEERIVALLPQDSRSISAEKIAEMQGKLKLGYTSFWS